MSSKERLIEDDLKKTTDYEALRELYYGKRTGLASFDKLWRKVRKEGLNYTQKEGDEEFFEAAIRSAADKGVQKAAAVHNDPRA